MRYFSTVNLVWNVGCKIELNSVKDERQDEPLVHPTSRPLYIEEPIKKIQLTYYTLAYYANLSQI